MTAEHPDLAVQDAVEAAVAGGLLESSREEVEELLGGQLLQQILSDADSATNPPPWAAGTFGPASLARRFIEFQRSAIRSQLCDDEVGGLKLEYARMLKPGAAKAGGLSTLSAALVSVFGAAAPVAGGAAIGVYTAVWLLHADLQAWCQECDGAKAEGLPRS
jgi:hypothetical protein